MFPTPPGTGIFLTGTSARERIRIQDGDDMMALFDRKAETKRSIAGPDAATRALSVTAVENDFVEGVYDKLAKVYDLFFGPTLHPGRLQAIQRMNIQPGERRARSRRRHRHQPVALPA